MSAATVDRYALVSSADALDRAWVGLGWSPGLDDERVSALRDTVPWPSVTAGLDDPAWLRGETERVLRPDNLDRLDFAFLPLDGRLSLSVWGAVGPRVEATREWRVLTHTLLFDRATFDALAGNPFELLGTARAPAGWVRELAERIPLDGPVSLEPVPVSLDREAIQARRHGQLTEVAQLGDRLLTVLGGDADALETTLARVFEALARVADGEARMVTLRGGEDTSARLLARLAWLSLPPADRAEIFFTTQQRRAGADPVSLAVLPPSEWGRLSPDGALSPDDVEVPESGGRRVWAAAVVDHVVGRRRGTARGSPVAYASMLRRVEARRWRVLGRDDLRRLVEQAEWARRWRSGDDPAGAASALIELERGRAPAAGGPRWRALGHVLALAERRATGLDREVSNVARARSLVDRLRGLAPDASVRVLRGLVRTLGRGAAADRALGGLVRCLASSGDAPSTPRRELDRLAGEEARLVDPLLADPYGPALLFRAAVELGRAGDESVTPLLRRSLGSLRDVDGALEWLERTARLTAPADARIVYQVLTAGPQVRDGAFPGADRFGEWVLDGVEGPTAGVPSAGLLVRWLLTPPVVTWFMTEAREAAQRRWLAVTGVPVGPIREACAHPGAAARLPRVVGMAVDLGHGTAATDLLRAGLELDPGAAWPAAMDGLPAVWLRAPATLHVLAAHPAAASHAVRRIAAELGGGRLSPPEVAGLLRLLWEERRAGLSSSIAWIERELPRHRAVPALAQLFVGPAPLGVATELRAALLRVVSGARGPVETGVPARLLRARAPAVANAVERALPGRDRLIFLDR